MNTKNKICPFCHKNISVKKHLKICNPDVNENIAYLMMVELTYDCKIINIINDYEMGYSLPDIKKKYGISYKVTTNILKINGIAIRSIKESSNENRLKKYKTTCNSKYGVDNVSKLTNIKRKKRNTFLKKYGVDNIFKTTEFKEKMKLRIANMNNVDWEKRLIKMLTVSSKPELIVKNILEINSIEFFHQKFINRNSYDFQIKDTNILIEVQGDYWHANPQIYKKFDLINYPKNKYIVADDIWKKDEIKKNIANKYGYVIIYIWESEIKNAINNGTIENFILNKIYENIEN